jgi:hypothetical protein
METHNEYVLTKFRNSVVLLCNKNISTDDDIVRKKLFLHYYDMQQSVISSGRIIRIDRMMRSNYKWGHILSSKELLQKNEPFTFVNRKESLKLNISMVDNKKIKLSEAFDELYMQFEIYLKKGEDIMKPGMYIVDNLRGNNILISRNNITLRDNAVIQILGLYRYNIEYLNEHPLIPNSIEYRSSTNIWGQVLSFNKIVFDNEENLLLSKEERESLIDNTINYKSFKLPVKREDVKKLLCVK